MDLDLQLETNHRRLDKVLVLEDDLSQEPKIKALLRSFNPEVEVTWATNLKSAKAQLNRKFKTHGSYDLILADMYLDADDDLGVDLLLEANQQYSREQLMLMSSRPLEKILHECNYSQLFPFLDKTQSISDIKKDISDLLEENEAPDLDKLADFFSMDEAPSLEKAHSYSVEYEWPVPQQVTERQMWAWGALMFITLFAVWIYELRRPFELSRVQQAPLVKALRSRPVQARFEDLLKSGLTPLLADPNWMKARPAVGALDQWPYSTTAQNIISAKTTDEAE